MKGKITHQVLSAAAMMLAVGACAPKSDQHDELYLLTGSYNGADTESVKVFCFDQQTGDWTFVSGAKGVTNPTFLCTNRAEDRVYAVGEFDEDDKATMNVFSFDKTSGTLTLLSSRMNGSGAPCNITLSPDEDYLLSANYCGGSVTIYRLAQDGTLPADPYTLLYVGHGANPERQEKPHLHAVNFTPDGKYLLTNDLGSDLISVFPVKDTQHQDTIQDPMPLLDMEHSYTVSVDPGAGPRHLCFSPDARFAYLITELSGQIYTLSYQDDTLRVVDKLVADTLQAGGSADIHITRDGRYLYASHRLQGDGISIYSVNALTGKLTRIGYQPTGIHPRNFALTPNDRYLLVACRDSNTIQVFARDEQTGMLSPVGKDIETPKPMFVTFLSK